jgi:hypothetical protein
LYIFLYRFFCFPLDLSTVYVGYLQISVGMKIISFHIKKKYFLFKNILFNIEAFSEMFFYLFPELGIRYFLPFSLFPNPLLQFSYSLSLLRYFSEICNTLFAICYTLFAIRYTLYAIRYSLLPLNSVIGFI